MKVDVYLDTGVCVDVPDATDLDSDDGLRTVKAAAKRALLDLLNNDDFDIQAEEYQAQE